MQKALQDLREHTTDTASLPISMEWATYTQRSSICFIWSWCIKAIHKSTVRKGGLQQTEQFQWLNLKEKRLWIHKISFGSYSASLCVLLCWATLPSMF